MSNPMNHNLPTSTSVRNYAGKESTSSSYSWRDYSVSQAPTYTNNMHLSEVENTLRQLPAIISNHEIAFFRNQMMRIHADNGFILQVGDCAETFRHSNLNHTAQRISLFSELHRILQRSTPNMVLTMGRMAGQFAKPRSYMTETIDGVTLPSYFGDAVNGNAPDMRTPDPDRLFIGYSTAVETIRHIRLSSYAWSSLETFPFYFGQHFFTSHEAYLLPYEQSLMRFNEQTGDTYASSAHFVWIGERTRDLNGAHIKFAEAISNPIGIKIGENTSARALQSLVKKLNPLKKMGRLSLIFRLGAQNIDRCLPLYIKALKGKPVIWICDPMHGNTKRTASGLKTRTMEDMMYEIRRFFEILKEHGIHPGGIHLEATPHNVYECVDTGADEGDLQADAYLTACDPRLNADQAVAIITYTGLLMGR